MSIYIKESGTWKEITGTNRPYAKVSGAWQGMTNAYTKVSGVWQPVYQYDNTAPTIPQPTVVLTSGTVNTVSWTAITDDITGVASATVYQRFFGSSTGLVSGASFALSSFGAGSTTFAIPSNRRNTPSGETWVVSYYIASTDNAGNSDTGAASSSNYTKPLGTYTVTTTGHGTWTLAQGWRTDFGSLGSVYSGYFGPTYSYQYGHWFYGSNVANAARGYVPDSGSIRTYRSSTDGCSGAVVAFGTHNYASQPGGSPANNSTYWTTGTSQTVGNAREFTLTAATLGRIAVDANFGMFMYPGYANGTIDGTANSSCASGTTYRIFDSPYVDGNSGRLTLVYS
jgi:hypothetical protein